MTVGYCFHSEWGGKKRIVKRQVLTKREEKEWRTSDASPDTKISNDLGCVWKGIYGTGATCQGHEYALPCLPTGLEQVEERLSRGLPLLFPFFFFFSSFFLLFYLFCFPSCVLLRLCSPGWDLPLDLFPHSYSQVVTACVYTDELKETRTNRKIGVEILRLSCENPLE